MKKFNGLFSVKIGHLLEQPLPFWVEALSLLLLLGVALFLRLWQLDVVPTGLHFDEAIDLKISQDIVNGARPIYVNEGWGREGLYYYLVAFVLQVVPYNPVALRVSSVIFGIGTLIVTYFLGKSWHGRLTAWLTVAWLSFAYWPLSATRFGYRHMSLAFLFGLTTWFFWQVWRTEKYTWKYALIGGSLLGLTMYTYQPARFTPFIFVAFAIYLVIFHQKSNWFNKPFWLAWFATFAITTLPLIFVLTLGSSNEGEQRAFVIEPLTEFLNGNIQPVLNNTLATVKAFTISGDPLKSYNVPHRPIFVPSWTGVFFYIGFSLALWRWRQPVFAFVLIWVFFTLLPTVVTVSAPNFNRMVTAQIPVMFLAAFPMSELIHWIGKHQQRVWTTIPILFLVSATFSSTIGATWHDYFDVWPNTYGYEQTLNREVSAVANYLEHHADGRSVVVSSRNIEDEDPYVVSVSMDRADFDIRWVDTSQAITIPAGVNETRLILTQDRWIDEDLATLTGVSTEIIYQEPEFTVFLLQDGDWTVADATQLLYLTPNITIPTTATLQLPDWSYPYNFCQCPYGEIGNSSLMLTGVSLAEQWQPGENLEMLTTWQTLEENSFVSLAMFVHLLNHNGEIVAQYDGLGYPPHTWHTGDRFAQIIRLPLNTNLPAGDYWLQFGLYERGTGQRWFLQNPQNSSVADRIVVGFLHLDETGTLRLSFSSLDS